MSQNVERVSDKHLSVRLTTESERKNTTESGFSPRDTRESDLNRRQSAESNREVKFKESLDGKTSILRHRNFLNELEYSFSHSTEDDIKQLKDFSDEDSDSSLLSFTEKHSSILEHNFLETLGEVPDLIHFEESEIVVVESNENWGDYTDPLSGHFLERARSTQRSIILQKIPIEDEVEGEELVPDEVEVEVEVETVEGVELPSAIEEDNDLLYLVEQDDEKQKVVESNDAELFVAFKDAETRKTVEDTPIVDWEELERRRHMSFLDNNTKLFLDHLINQVVDKCEYVDSSNMLRKEIDKGRLINKLIITLHQFEIEKKTQNFLDRKVVEYFRRRKQMRPLTDCPVDMVQAEKLKLSESIDKLNCCLGQEAETKQTIDNNMFELEMELEDLQNAAETEERHFEELVTKIIHRDGFERLKLFIGEQLKLMHKTKEDISAARLVLIHRRHSLASVMEKTAQLENIGNGLKMDDFTTIYTDIFNLNKKIEERNTDLAKMRYRCTSENQIMAHLKEKQLMVRSAVDIQKLHLVQLKSDSLISRGHLLDLKSQRTGLRSEIIHASLQGGILSKPALMLDYDETVDKLTKLTSEVTRKRKAMDDILDKIALVEKALVPFNAL